MERKEKALIILSLVIAIFVHITVTFLNEVRYQDIHIKCVKEELKDAQGDRDYYQSQYKKYYKLSEELQNQMGVYAQ